MLAEIGAVKTSQFLVVNISECVGEGDGDLASLTHRLLGETARQNATEAVAISALSGAGVPKLLETIDQNLAQDPVARQRFRLPLGEGRALHLLHDRAAVVSKTYGEHYCEVVADAPQSIRERLAEFAVDE